MRNFNIWLLIAALIILVPSAGNLAIAEKGDRGGREGRSQSGGDNRGSGQSLSGKGNQSNNANKNNEQSNQNFSARDFQRGTNNDSSNPKNKPADGVQQKSFYRGPNSKDSDGAKLDRNIKSSDGNKKDSKRDRSDQSLFDGQGKSRDNNDFDRSVDHIRKDWKFDQKDRPFQYGWWDHFHGKAPVFGPWRSERWRDRTNYWWGWSTPNYLTNWLVFRWAQPAYWTYGPGFNIYYQDDYVYYDGKQVMPVDKYYSYIYDLAHNLPKIDESEIEKMDWTPLGVFAVTRDNEANSQRALQLAVNRDGVISGTYYNREKGEMHPVAGRVDERTQRASWAFADGADDAIVFETSIYNLTKNTCTVMVHFGPRPNETEVWQLVRLEQPEGAAGSSGQQAPRRELP